MPTALVNGVNIYYESHGSGTPLVLAYGLGGNTGEWAGQVDALSPRYRLVLWDPRGHGRSESPPGREQYGLDISAQDLGALLDHLSIDVAYVGGLSMGAGISVRFCLAHPQRVSALLLIDSASASGLPTAAHMRAMRERSIELAETEGMAAVADYCIDANPNLKTQAESGPEALDGLRQMFLALNPTGYANTIRAMLQDVFPVERLETITAPTLVLVGEEDPALEAARLCHKNIAGSHFEVIPGGGHLSNLDRPEQFNSAILSFLKTVEAGSAGGR
jgi:pimeloyl-ACP methyl ester carboxylesterase